MKTAYLLLVAFASLLATIPPPPTGKADQGTTLAPPMVDLRTPLRASENLTAWVGEIRAQSNQAGSFAHLSTGNLWIEVDRLKSSAQDVRSLEYYVSDLEGALRGGQRNAIARRHILNNLEHEIGALNRRLQR